MEINFLTLNKDDLLAVCAIDTTREVLVEQMTEYFVTICNRAPYKDEDVVEWFLDNHTYYERDSKWYFILLI